MTQTITCFQLDQCGNIVMVNVLKTRYSFVTWASEHQPGLCCTWIYYSQGKTRILDIDLELTAHMPSTTVRKDARVCGSVLNIFVKIHHVLKDPHLRGLWLMPRIFGHHIWGRRLSMHAIYHTMPYWKQLEYQIPKGEKNILLSSWTFLKATTGRGCLSLLR